MMFWSNFLMLPRSLWKYFNYSWSIMQKSKSQLFGRITYWLLKHHEFTQNVFYIPLLQHIYIKLYQLCWASILNIYDKLKNIVRYKYESNQSKVHSVRHVKTCFPVQSNASFAFHSEYQIQAVSKRTNYRANNSNRIGHVDYVQSKCEVMTNVQNRHECSSDEGGSSSRN